MFFAPSALSRNDLRHPGRPTLYSLFETQENIKLLGLKNAVSYQRYLSAWDFSAQLCSIEHPGRAPCFFPSDFSAASGTRLVFTITTLVKNCSSLLFYEEYHRRSTAPNYPHTTLLFIGSSAGIEVEEVLREYERTLDENERTVIESESLAPSDVFVGLAKTPVFRPHEGFGGNYDPRKPRWSKFSLDGGTRRHIHMTTNDESSECSGLTEEGSVIITGHENYNTSTMPFPKVVNPDERQDRGHFPGPDKIQIKAGNVGNEKSAVDLEVAEKLESLKNTETFSPKEKPKLALFRSLDSFKRAFVRKCLSGLSHIRLDTSQWGNAEDSFIKRLTHEFHEIEVLIQEFLEVL